MSERSFEMFMAFRRNESEQGSDIGSRLELPEHEPTAEESQTVEAAILAFSELAQEMRLPGTQFSKDRIHFIDPSVRGKTVGGLGLIDESAEGFWQDGHVYIIRSPSMLVTAHTLTHELAHGVSYYASASRKLSSQDEPAVYDTEMQTGLYVWTPDTAKKVRSEFRGLNEAMTELTANLVRWRVGRAVGLDDMRMQLLETELNYKPQVAVLEAIFSRLAKQTEDNRGAFDLLLRDYLTGQRRFLDEVEQIIPGATVHLAAMDTTFESALETASALGLDETIKELRQLAEVAKKAKDGK